MKSLLHCLLIALSMQYAGCFSSASAQTARPPQPTPPPALVAPLQVAPPVIGLNGTITLALPPNFPYSNSRWRIGLFEQGKTIPVADALRDFMVRGGSLQTNLTIQAEPGAYEVRLISNDRARLPISQPAPLLVTGVRREPGWWLLNGSPFIDVVANEANATPANVLPLTATPPNAPLFVPNLKRDLSRRGRAPSFSIPLPSAGALSWKVLTLPPLRTLLASNSGDVRAQIATLIREAQASGQRYYIGFELPTGTGENGVPLPLTVANTIGQLRQIITSLAPDAALILGVDVNAANAAATDAAVQAISMAGPLCDAVVIRLDPVLNGTWPVKAARRVAEEQPHYDLPIFVQIQSVAGAAQRNTLMPPAAVLDYWMSGATGIINGDQLVGNWRPLVQRNAALFVNSVTLEDAGILPLGEELSPAPDATSRLYEVLRSARRIPLMANTLVQKGRVPESSVIALGNRINDVTVQALSTTARGGARLYIEGAPTLDERGQTMWKLAPLVGATATSINKKRTTMILEDAWTFGMARGTRIVVEQDVSVKLSPGSLVKQPKPQKGRAVLTEPHVAARLEDGSPAIIITPVDKGEVIWMPYRIVSDATPGGAAIRTGAANNASTAPLAPLTAPNAVVNSVDRATPLQRYYDAIVSYLQGGLVQVRGTDAQQAGAEAVRVALRRSPKGTMLLALFNTGQQPASIAAGVQGVFTVALDLAEEKELPVASRGFLTEAATTLPANGWKIIAFAESRKALDTERNTPRAQARLR